MRNEERAGPVKARYPGARLVYGTLDDSAVIEKAAAEADIVIREYCYYYYSSSSPPSSLHKPCLSVDIVFCF